MLFLIILPKYSLRIYYTGNNSAQCMNNMSDSHLTLSFARFNANRQYKRIHIKQLQLPPHNKLPIYNVFILIILGGNEVLFFA